MLIVSACPICTTLELAYRKIDVSAWQISVCMVERVVNDVDRDAGRQIETLDGC